MELSDLMDQTEERLNAVKTYLDDEQEDDAKAEFLRMAQEIQDYLKPEEKPTEETGPAPTPDGTPSNR